ncbi:hypothetical protein L3X38_005130 [Prunus dulcis]|uniref:Uncharacterized protein n=1 Tax=Prunus dulcis TaxID=3755 RepID=A0AAD4ZQD2_PRUDU|nr:hypothetical protein L3X38_005130 [Prunus dulcis]
MNFSPISFFHVHVFIHESCKQVDADRGDGQSFQFFDSTSRMYRFDRRDWMGWVGKAGRTGVSRNSDRVGSIGIFIDGIGEKPIKIHYVPYVTAGARCLATTGS